MLAEANIYSEPLLIQGIVLSLIILVSIEKYDSRRKSKKLANNERKLRRNIKSSEGLSTELQVVN
jgi:hypothetical protein